MGYYLLDNANVVQQYGYPRRGGCKPSGTIIVHTAEGNGRTGVARFIASRLDYGSYHRLADDTGVTKMLPFEYEAWQDTETNNWGIGISAACFAADWNRMAPAKADAILRNLAKAAAEAVEYMRATHGINVPIRRITGAQARAGLPGFAAHGDSGVNRTDPGAAFNWDKFFTYVNQELGRFYATTATTTERIEEIMATLDQEDYDNIAKAVWRYDQQGKTKQAWHYQKNVGLEVWATKLKNRLGKTYSAAANLTNNNVNGWDILGLVKSTAGALVKKSDIDAAVADINAHTDEAMVDAAIEVEVTVKGQEKI